jgi:acetoin utilization protein AcuB
MLVSEWMTPDPVTVSPRTSVLAARRLLHLHGIRHLPVMDDGRLVGIVSDRDLAPLDPLVAASLTALHSDVASGRWRAVEAVMSTPPQVAHPDDHLAAAARTLLHWRLSALPVVSEGQLVGIITTTDCLEALMTATTAPAATDGGDW